RTEIVPSQRISDVRYGPASGGGVRLVVRAYPHHQTQIGEYIPVDLNIAIRIGFLEAIDVLPAGKPWIIETRIPYILFYILYIPIALYIRSEEHTSELQSRDK